MEPENLPDQQSLPEQTLAQLERQVERGSLFTHTIVSRNADQIHETESFLYGLMDILIAKGLVTRDEVLQSVSRVRQEMEAKGLTIGPGLALRIEGEATKGDDFVPVNCAERLHLCKAVCCKLNFALTAEEIESGHVKWDLGEPYYIRHEASGYCHHVTAITLGCSIYAHRPGVCRRYSCAHDPRIWTDFEKMELNTEWIQANLSESRPRLAQAAMIGQADLLAGIQKESA